MPYIGWQIAFFNQNCNNALAYQCKVKLITKKVKTKLSKHFGSVDMRFNNFVHQHQQKLSGEPLDYPHGLSSSKRHPFVV